MKFELLSKLLYNPSMKKLLLFLLLTLSVLSAQSSVGLCPDGSEPVKSVSEDGTYFVYSCDNKSNDGDDKTNNPTKSSDVSIDIVVEDANGNPIMPKSDLPTQTPYQGESGTVFPSPDPALFPGTKPGDPGYNGTGGTCGLACGGTGGGSGGTNPPAGETGGRLTTIY
jgi:hypothetical protein